MSDKWHSDVPISRPVAHADETGSFNGFAWAEGIGIVVEKGGTGKEVLETLKDMRRTL